MIQDDGVLWTSAATVVPRLSDEVFRALLTHAHKLGMRVYVHVTQRVDAERAVAARADVFIHGVMDTTLPDSLWNRMREQRLVWAPALRIVAACADRGAYAKRILADPVLTSSLSQQELDALTADAAGTISARDEPFPGLLPNGSRYILQENTRQARAHGLPIAVGSDAGAAGNGPGVGSHMEMELLQNAGLSPAEMITAATFAGARAIGMEDQLGTVAPGKLADLLILNRDPTTDIRNARVIEWIIKGGRALRPGKLVPATRTVLTPLSRRPILARGATSPRVCQLPGRASDLMPQYAAVQQTVTSLLVTTDVDHVDVWDRLVPLVYSELRRMAHAQLAREGEALLDTTELVHEAFLRLVDGTQVVGNGRSYFFGAAARAMRQVLVDHARWRRRQKRGSGASPITLKTSHLIGQPTDYDLVELDGALTRLSTEYPRAAKVVECRFFGGLSIEETGEVLGIAPRTVKRDWALARAWLHRELLRTRE